MAVVTMPFTLGGVGHFGVRQQRYDMTEMSDVTGATAVRVLAPPRWRLTLGSTDNVDLATASAWEAMATQLRGAVNVLAVFDPLRALPRGTSRGQLVSQYQMQAGDTTATLIGGNPGTTQTLLQGDWVQFGTGFGSSQTVKLTADATLSNVQASQAWSGSLGAQTWSGSLGAQTWFSSGQRAITFEPPLRNTYASGALATIDHALIYCRVLNDALGGDYVPGFISMGGFAFDLLESFS